MHWTDTAIVLSARKHGENSAVLRVLTPNHGVWAGVVRGAHSKTTRGVIQPGNKVNASWNARLPEQLGNFKAELLEANAALIMQDAARLAALTSACAVIESALPERHPYEKLYTLLLDFLDILKEDDNWPEAYVHLELALLAESGFGLDLSCCAATGSTEDLIYVSPKSGRAVSREAGEPYREKLLRLPEFLLPPPANAGEGVSRSPLPRSGGGSGRGPTLKEKARQLRKTLTDAERMLWYHLRAHRFNGYQFRRQYPVENRYIVDFVCLEKMLVVELDGGQHAEQQNYDQARTEILEQRGYRVLRFWNNEMLGNQEGVLETILQALQSPPPRPSPASREREQSRPLSRVSGGGLGRGASEEILAGLRLTGYFLEHWLLEPHRRKLPAARQRLVVLLQPESVCDA